MESTCPANEFFFLAPFASAAVRVGMVESRENDLGPAGQTAWCWDLAPAGVSLEVVQGWGCASSTRPRRDGELEEGSRKRALRSGGDDATPPEDPRSQGRSPQRGRGASRPRPSKEANEGGSLRVPAPPDFKPENDESTSPTAVKFGISLPPLAARSVAQGTAKVGGSPGLQHPLARHRADEGRIDREPACHMLRLLHTTSMRRASWTGTSRFMADKATLRPTCAPASWQTRARARSRQCAGCKDARVGAGGAVISILVKEAPAGAGVRTEGKGQAESPQEQDAEVRVKHGNDVRRGQNCEDSRSMRSSLVTAAALGTQVKHQQCASQARALIASMGGPTLPAPEGLGRHRVACPARYAAASAAASSCARRESSKRLAAAGKRAWMTGRLSAVGSRKPTRLAAERVGGSWPAGRRSSAAAARQPASPFRWSRRLCTSRFCASRRHTYASLTKGVPRTVSPCCCGGSAGEPRLRCQRPPATLTAQAVPRLPRSRHVSCDC